MSSAKKESNNAAIDRRTFITGAAAGATMLALPKWVSASAVDPVLASAAWQEELAPIRAEVTKRHDEALQRLQTWIRQPSIAAENRGMNEGCELTMQMLREAGFQ